jgi:two-component system, LytTR family, response regulator
MPEAGPPVRVLVVDDEPLARDCVTLALGDAPDVEVVGSCGDGEAAVEALARLAPDVVFLDVRMPGLDGFEVMARSAMDPPPIVVFVTAYDAHAVRAFEASAIDYVLKPFENARLLQALARARARLAERRGDAMARGLAAAFAMLRGEVPAAVAPATIAQGTAAQAAPPARFVTRFAVREDDRTRYVPVHAVDWIGVDGNYVVLHAGGATHRVRATLQGLVESLDPRTFAQVHRSCIVNLERVRELQPWFGGDQVAILADGTRLRVSRTFAAALLEPVR